ncbi:hypothetical protein LB505_005275 [Fusarium chuoi]|nr:hypothetical protein LB505_005275 [Fusarium chuoi]
MDHHSRLGLSKQMTFLTTIRSREERPSAAIVKTRLQLIIHNNLCRETTETQTLTTAMALAAHLFKYHRTRIAILVHHQTARVGTLTKSTQQRKVTTSSTPGMTRR